MFRTPRKVVAIAAAVSLGAATLVAASATTASAGSPGLTYQLTSSNGTTTIFGTGLIGTVTGIPEKVTDASWVPDGSRAIYVVKNGTKGDYLSSVRFNISDDIIPLSDPKAGASIAHPVWYGRDGILFSYQPKAGAPWQLDITLSGPGSDFSVITATQDGNSYTHPDTADNGAIVAEQTVGSAHNIVYWAPNSPTPTTVVSNATDPAISADGTTIAYVQSDGSHNQIFLTDPSGSAPTQLTTGAHNYDNPTFAPESIHWPNPFGIAFNVDGTTNVDQMTLNPTGAIEAVSGLKGVPAYEPVTDNDSSTYTNYYAVLFGADRYATAIRISQQMWADAAGSADGRRQAKAIVLTRGDTYADALAGSALAAAKDAPLLMTPPSALNPDILTEIQRILAPGSGTIYVLGGTGAVSQSTEDELTGLGYSVKRLAGANRFATAIAIANTISVHPDFILAATGQNFPDALGAGAAAGSYDAPEDESGYTAVVVLTNDGKLPTETNNYMKAWSKVPDPDGEVFGVGVQGFTAMKAYKPLEVAASNRYATAQVVAHVFFDGETAVGLTTGDGWPDALAGGAMLGTINAPLMLTEPGPWDTDLDGYTAYLFDENSGSITQAFQFGGNVPQWANEEAGSWIGGPSGAENGTPPQTATARVKPNTTGTPNSGSPAQVGKRTLSQIRAAVGTSPHAAH